MSGKFCPKCGRMDADFYEGFCIDCYVNTNVQTRLPGEIEIVQCKRCGSWFFKNEWIEDSFKSLKRIIADRLKTNLYSPNVSVDTEGNEALVSVSGFIDKNRHYQIERDYRMSVRFKDATCDKCRKLAGKSFEYKVQLRRAENHDPETFARIAKFVKREIAYLSEKMPESKAFWFEENKDGIDFFFGFRKAGDFIVKSVGDKFHVRFERSSKIAGLDRKTGRMRYQMTFCARV
ncbi:MAG: 60S ribosomal export protein NMD3 [archaeon]